MGFLDWLFATLRNRRISIQNNLGRSLIFGTIYKIGLYRNYKHDPSPLILVMYSGNMSFVHKSGHYTDGINLNYLDNMQKAWLAKAIYTIRKSGQIMNGATLYNFIKINNPTIISKAYRRYHTEMFSSPKMVSAAITNYDKLCYPYNDIFIINLNKSIAPSELNKTIQINQNQQLLSPEKLNERIIQARNSIPINQIRQQPQQNNNLAPWIKKI